MMTWAEYSNRESGEPTRLTMREAIVDGVWMSLLVLAIVVLLVLLDS